MPNVTVTKDRYTVEPLYQWDKNQVLTIYGLSMPSIPEIHFTNGAMDRAIVRQSTMDAAGVIRANVPNSLLQKSNDILAYVCTYEGDTFKSWYKITIPVKARQRPNDYTIEDTDGEIYSFNALENLVYNALDKCDEANVKYLDAIACAEAAEKTFDEATKTATKTFNESSEKCNDATDKYTEATETLNEATTKYNEATETLNEANTTLDEANETLGESIEKYNAATDTLNEIIEKSTVVAHTYGTEDLVAGESPLATGTLYSVYEA